MNTLDSITLPDGSQYLYDTTKWRLLEQGETLRPGDQMVLLDEYGPTTRPVSRDLHGHFYVKGRGVVLRPLSELESKPNIGTIILAIICLAGWAAVAWMAWVLYTATR